MALRMWARGAWRGDVLRSLATRAEGGGSKKAAPTVTFEAPVQLPKEAMAAPVRRSELVSELVLRPAGAPDLPHWVQTPLDLLVFKARTVAQVLALLQQVGFEQPRSIPSLISHMAKMAAADPAEKLQSLHAFSKDGDLRNIIAEYRNEFTTGGQLLLLRSLLPIGLSCSDPLVQQCQKALLPQLSTIPLPSLLPLMFYHEAYKDETPLSSELQGKIKATVESLAPEITLQNLFSLLGSELVNVEWQAKLEAVAVNLLPQMTDAQLSLVVEAQAVWKRRNVGLIRSVIERLHRSDASAHTAPLPLHRLVALVGAAQRLQLDDERLFARIAADFAVRAHSLVKWNDVTSLFIYLGRWRFGMPSVLQLLCERAADLLRESPTSATVNNLLAVVVSLANLNFTPDKCDVDGVDLVSWIAGRVRGSVGAVDAALWLDVVRSLAILRCLDAPTAAAALDAAFYEPLLDRTKPSDYKNVTLRLKLLNVNSYCRYELPAYDGPLLDVESGMFEPIEIMAQSSLRKHSSSMIPTQLADVIQHLAPKGTHSRVDFLGPDGYLIDAELALDDAGRPINLESTDAAKERVAVLLWDYHQLTRARPPRLTGLNAMTVRHLTAAGYRLVQVFESEFVKHRLSTGDDVGQIEYVRSLLRLRPAH